MKHEYESRGDKMETELTTRRETHRPVSAVTVLACAWPALLLATACLLPFLNKPFLVDDPHFLMMARQIGSHPTHPMDFTVCWNLSNDCTKAYLLTPGNALIGYVLVPTVVGGAHEWMAQFNAAGAGLDCNRGDDFPGTSLRMGPGTRNRRRSASRGHCPISPPGQHRHAR